MPPAARSTYCGLPQPYRCCLYSYRGTMYAKEGPHILLQFEGTCCLWIDHHSMGLAFRSTTFGFAVLIRTGKVIHIGSTRRIGPHRWVFPASGDVGIHASRVVPSGLLCPATLYRLRIPTRVTSALCAAPSTLLHHLEHCKVLQACPVSILGQAYHDRLRSHLSVLVPTLCGR